MDIKDISCVDCKIHACFSNSDNTPSFCPTKCHTDIREEAFNEAMKPENNKVLKAAAEIEYKGYCRLTRVEEIIHFARKIGAKKLGIGCCLGFSKEAKILADILRVNNFEVASAICKTGSVLKTDLGFDKAFEEVGVTTCNPIMQAKLLNAQKTDLNIVVGLCVGHDSLFMKYSDALCTYAVVKDRVTGHNPVAVLYQADAYYKKLKEPLEEI